MKKMITVFILIIPALSFCQFEEDYCPCMDEPSTNPYVNMMNMVSMVNGGAELFTMDLPTRSYTQIKTADFSQKEASTPTIADQTTNTVALREEATEVMTKVRSKKRKKRNAFHLAPKPKNKKYKGKCPRF